jgi:uncharacterized protein (DUF1330 family)
MVADACGPARARRGPLLRSATVADGRRGTEGARMPYLEPTAESGRRYFSRPVAGPVVMLNLLRFRAVADYSATPALAPPEPVSGAEAYQRYVDHTLPHLRASGGEVLFTGSSDRFLIGPPDERWDLAILVRHRSQESFLSFASNEPYLDGMAHRLAALEDSRLLPMVEQPAPTATE